MTDAASAPAAPPLPPRRKRRTKPEPPAPYCQWVYVEPELTPALTPEQVRELYAADHIEALRRWKRSVPRRPHHCRVGTSYYPEADRSVPYIRLRGGWLAQAGFVAGDQVRVEFLRDALVLSRIPPPPPPPEMPKRRSRKPSWRD